jgi:hypothetical protein
VENIGAAPRKIDSTLIFIAVAYLMVSPRPALHPNASSECTEVELRVFRMVHSEP